ncbi:hypothetical protein M427DRAFT_68430 [Gonapodya prolifera JEL478]|uniref:Nascent polypeptide-associated complex subunit alpha-like UBA domain-containing protein n=1 Tax=Gonapodya prolifera (strain JEL478) TaxID=1344416 RepID=A0A139ALK5_GONPJ|nr:hypothetical protein M427DRAFT_68430 [Gonapodya prolifera JEL478]|eukprot:KXS17651.1 hypothetical protein M427DRAFT_68430 [Gonapodya prolifera JEL478]
MSKKSKQRTGASSTSSASASTTSTSTSTPAASSEQLKKAADKTAATTPTNSEDAAAADERDEEEDVKGHGGQARKDMQNVNAYLGEDMAQAVDETKLGQAMTALATEKAKQKAQQRARERELEKIVVSKEDVDVLMGELDLTKLSAERALREAGGSLRDALQKALRA